jgi:hypothetical protein
VAAEDAPDGAFVARVRSTASGKQYGIDEAPDAEQSRSAKGRHYTASAWIKADAGTDGRPVCIAIREAGGRADVLAEGRVTARADGYRRVSASYVATADDRVIDVHVHRGAAGVGEGEAFLADSIVLTSDDAGGPDDQRVAAATCG